MLRRWRRTLRSARNQFIKLSDVLGNDLLGCGNLFPASGQRLLGDRLQRIDVVEINAVESVHIRSNITRDGDIDNEEWPIDPRAQHWSKFFLREQRNVGRCRRNQDVNFAALLEPLFKGDSAATDGESDRFGAFRRAIADAQIRDTARNQRPNRAFARFTRAEHENFAIAEITKNFLGKIDSNRADRDSAACNLGMCADLLGHSKSPLKQPVQISAGSSRRTRRFVRLFCLPKNFSLAHHHGIESGGDAKQMSHAIARFVAIERFKMSIDFNRVRPGETTCDLFGGHETLRRGINFDAIAGTEHQRLIATAIPQRALGLDTAGKVFARLDVRVVMTETDAEQIHGVCVWAVNVMPQRRVNAALKPMMQSAATRFGANQCKYRPCKINP